MNACGKVKVERDYMVIGDDDGINWYQLVWSGPAALLLLQVASLLPPPPSWGETGDCCGMCVL